MGGPRGCPGPIPLGVLGTTGVTGEQVVRNGLELIVFVTGGCLGQKVSLSSLISRNIVNLGQTIRGFSPSENCQFDACDY